MVPDPRLLIGLEGPDDAAVYQLDGGDALVASLDFFTPLVDDPSDFGAIAAANALSDIYAMGARPLFGLNVLAVPVAKLSSEVIGAILKGAAEICRHAGIPVAGGHSIDDEEPKFGMVVLGLVDPERMWRKSGAQPGDVLVLGKALGTGIVTTALKRGTAETDEVEAAVASMRRLNRTAAEVLKGLDVHCATDVTGFGLLGHLLEVCRASGVSAVIEASAPRLLPGALRLAAAGNVPGGTRRNERGAEGDVEWSDGADQLSRDILHDPQTSGGLLVALDHNDAERAVGELRDAGYDAAVIGRVVEGDGAPRVKVNAGEVR